MFACLHVYVCMWWVVVCVCVAAGGGVCVLGVRARVIEFLDRSSVYVCVRVCVAGGGCRWYT
jgi:hypothetical protein